MFSLYSHKINEYVDASKAPVCVEWNVAKDAAMKKVVSHAIACTSSNIGYRRTLSNLLH
jgi:hypothetical protein